MAEVAIANFGLAPEVVAGNKPLAHSNQTVFDLFEHNLESQKCGHSRVNWGSNVLGLVGSERHQTDADPSPCPNILVSSFVSQRSYQSMPWVPIWMDLFHQRCFGEWGPRERATLAVTCRQSHGQESVAGEAIAFQVYFPSTKRR